MGTGPALDWLRGRDPGLVATRRAVRVTAAACAAFYVCRYGLDDPQMAVYAVFGAFALGALSEVRGRPWQRTATYALTWLVGLPLVALGTALAGRTWAAALGMLVVGVVVAFAGVGGPRVIGVANGLQLLYILPSFPPYAPDELGSRLAGLTIGVGLLALADRLLLPPAVPRPFRDRLGAAVAAVDGRLRTLLDGTAVPERSGRDAVRPAVLRLSQVPPIERPTGPGREDRAQLHIARLLRSLDRRTADLVDLTPMVGDRVRRGPEAALLASAADDLRSASTALQGERAPPDPAGIDRALDAFLETRRTRASSVLDQHHLAARLRQGVLVEETALLARDLGTAVRVAVGRTAPADAARATTAPADPLWYVVAPWWQLWTQRLRGHLSLRSVLLQNALRLGIGLALARAVAGALELQHGFWVLLATLTLLRTSAVTTRSTVRPALLGTAIGAVVAGALLVLVGTTELVYAVALPVVMVLGLVAGRIWGLLVAQALFTVIVALLFVQLSPASWELAGVRLLDVVVGGLLGVLAGLLVWPRGAGAELARTSDRALHAAADDVEATVGTVLGGAEGAPGLEAPAPSAEWSAGARRAAHLLSLADSTYAQLRSELGSAPSPHGRSPAETDWLGVLTLVHESVWGGDLLRRTHPASDPLPWPQVAAELADLGRVTADDLREVGASVDGSAPPEPARGRPTPERDTDVRRRLGGDPTSDPAREPEALLRAADLYGWLSGLQADAARARSSGASGS